MTEQLTDLEAVARLLGDHYVVMEHDGETWIEAGDGSMLHGWNLAGACMEKLAEMGYEPGLWHEPGFGWLCEGDGDEWERVRVASAPAAILACAAAVYRQMKGGGE